MESVDKKRSAKDINKDIKDIIIRECSCYREECLCLNFLSCVKNISKFIDNQNNDTDDSEDEDEEISAR